MVWLSTGLLFFSFSFSNVPIPPFVGREEVGYFYNHAHDAMKSSSRFSSRRHENKRVCCLVLAQKKNDNHCVHLGLERSTIWGSKKFDLESKRVLSINMKARWLNIECVLDPNTQWFTRMDKVLRGVGFDIAVQFISWLQSYA